MAEGLFSLETLAAKHGDCLMLHWGDPATPQLMLIDGGPGGVYRNFLKKRLRQLAQKRGAPVVLNYVMISHIDDDHIHGILDLTADIEKAFDDGRDPLCEIDEMWFNAFDDVVGNIEVAAFRDAATLSGLAPKLSHTGAVIASVGQGRKLRDCANRLGVKVNGGDRLIVGGWEWDMGDGLTLEVLAPRLEQIEEFQRAWDKEVKKKGWAVQPDGASIAAFLDKSPYNLASTVAIARHGGKSILLTGDARGDHVLEALDEHGYLDGRAMHVDVLKVPHHGSDNNVSTAWFRQVTADHYVISGDGHHGNPEIATLEMIRSARGNSNYKVHLTYRHTRHGHEPELRQFLTRLSAREQSQFVFRPDDALSIRIDLNGRLRD